MSPSFGLLGVSGKRYSRLLAQTRLFLLHELTYFAGRVTGHKSASAGDLGIVAGFFLNILQKLQQEGTTQDGKTKEACFGRVGLGNCIH